MQLAAPVDRGYVQQVAVARAWLVHVGPHVPRVGLVDDDLGDGLGFLRELALGGFGGALGGARSRGRDRAGPFRMGRSRRCNGPTRLSWRRSF